MVKIDNEFKRYIRPLNQQEYEKLEASLLAEGIRDSLICWDGILLDGYHRYQIAQENDLEYRVTEIELPDRDAAKEWMITNQLGRRNLTPEESSYYRGKLYEARKRQGARTDLTSHHFDEKLNTAEQIAKEYGVSKPTVERDAKFSEAVDKVAEEIGEYMRDAILSGTAKVAKQDVEDLFEIAEDAEELIPEIAAGKMTMKEAKSKVSKKRREETHAEKRAAPLPEGKYRVIYADPPWRYGVDQHSKKEQDTVLESHYPTMPLDEICALPIRDMAADDCVLFLWATSPLLPQAFEVIKAWGFNYKASYVWDKIKHNVGYYNSVRHELLLIATRGSCLPDKKPEGEPILIDSVQSIERTEHSRKPEEFRRIIEHMYPTGRKRELFSRIKADGWEGWGNEPT